MITEIYTHQKRKWILSNMKNIIFTEVFWKPGSVSLGCLMLCVQVKMKHVSVIQMDYEYRYQVPWVGYLIFLEKYKYVFSNLDHSNFCFNYMCRYSLCPSVFTTFFLCTPTSLMRDIGIALESCCFLFPQALCGLIISIQTRPWIDWILHI